MNLLRKINSILSLEEKKKARNLFLLMLIGMLLEMLGVGIVIPLITLLTRESHLPSLPFWSNVGNEFGEIGQVELVYGAMAALVLVYLVKNLFLGFLLWSQSNFAYGVQANLSKRLFFTYLNQPYVFHLRQNSAQLIRNATTEANLFASHALMQGMQLTAELLVVLGLAMLLMLVEPLGTLIVGLTLAIVATLFFRATRKRVLTWGAQRQFHEGLRLQHLQQGLGGIKDVILTGRQMAFLGQYDQHNTAASIAARHQEFLKQVPRLSLEWLAILGIAVLVMSMMVQGKALADVTPVIGAFAAAAFRLMPSINRILGSIQTLRYVTPVIDTLHNQVSLPPVFMLGNNSAPLRFEQEIRVENLTFSYEPDSNPVIKNINLSIKRGQTVGFVGTSGAGKSTLIDLLLGLLKADEGIVLVDAQDIQHNLRAWHKKIGYVPQSIFLTDDTLMRNIAFGVADDQIDESAVIKSIKAAQLEEFVRGLPEGLSTPVGERGVRLSGGQRQRIGIARALYNDPDVLVLDEATSALDNSTESEVMKPIISMHGIKTIVVVAHRLSTVEQCDYIYRLEAGCIVKQGKPAEVLYRSAGLYENSLFSERVNK